ncbi:MAG: tetratricopeptide repeat protein [Coraliomargaritaceae bacterium]
MTARLPKSLGYLLVSLFALCLQPSFAQKAKQDRADLYYSFAQSQYESGDAPSAYRFIEQVLRIAPKHPEALHLKELLDQGIQAKTIDTTTRVTPSSKNAKTNPLSRDPSIMARLGQAIESDPNLQDLSNYLRGRAALAQGRAGSARACFDKALQQLPSPNDPLRGHIHFHQALCQEALGRQKRAEADLKQAFRFGYHPESQSDANKAAAILLRAKQYKDALQLLSAIVRNHPNPSPANWAMLGRTHQALGQTQRAISAFSQSLVGKPGQASVLALRAGLYRRLEQFSFARNDYEEALQITPQDSALHYALGLLHIRLGDLEKAYQNLVKASSEKTLPPENELYLALLAHARGNTTTAKQHIHRYLETVEENTNETAYYLDYVIASLRGENSEARQALQSRAEAPQASAALGTYFAYCQGLKTRKEILDQAGRANSPKQAKQQICETAYWMAQYHQTVGDLSSANDLLLVARRNGQPEWIEYQLASWQLEQTTPLQP